MTDRRRFITTSAAASAAAIGSIWLPRPAVALDVDNPFRRDIGIQLYTLRDAIADDPMATLRRVAEIGYRQVESYGFPDCDPILAAADAAGLPVRSSHFNSDDLVSQDDLDSFKPILDKANRIGLSHLVIPYISDNVRASLDDYRRICERCNRAAESAETAGITLAYHNHAFEFEPMGDAEGDTGSTRGYDIMVDQFDAAMKFEVDVFWVQVAGVDPISLMDKLDGRISQLHLKDLADDIAIPTYNGIALEAFKEIGNGVVAIESIMDKAARIGVDHCHVEQDHSPHPIDSIETSFQAIAAM